MEYKLFNKKTKQWIDHDEDEEYNYFTKRVTFTS